MSLWLSRKQQISWDGEEFAGGGGGLGYSHFTTTVTSTARALLRGSSTGSGESGVFSVS